MPRDNSSKGLYGENIACGYLEEKGYIILDKRYRCPFGEIDLIARKGEDVVFVEVKFRSSRGSGYAAEAVTPSKQRAIIKTAFYYIGEKDLADTNFRFDVVEVYSLGEIRVRHIENAFYCE